MTAPGRTWSGRTTLTPNKISHNEPYTDFTYRALLLSFCTSRAPERIRTFDLQFRKLPLYPLSYKGIKTGSRILYPALSLSVLTPTYRVDCFQACCPSRGSSFPQSFCAPSGTQTRYLYFRKVVFYPVNYRRFYYIVADLQVAVNMTMFCIVIYCVGLFLCSKA
jgi:hypothetical protein